MTADRADTLVVWGFLTAYLAIMGTVIVVCVPGNDTVREQLILYALLPAAAIGVVTVIAANIFHPRR